jgi:hypothetical protein
MQPPVLLAGIYFMGMKKMMLVGLVAFLPSSVLGSFNTSPYTSNGVRYSQNKIAFPVRPEKLYSQPKFNFEIMGKTLVIADENSGMTKAVDTKTGLECGLTEGYAQKMPIQTCTTSTGAIQVAGNPAKVIYHQLGGYVIDSDRYITLTEVPVAGNVRQFQAKFIDHGKVKANLVICKGINFAQIIGDTLIIYSSDVTVTLCDLKTNRTTSFDCTTSDGLFEKSWHGHGKYMIFGRTLIDIQQHERMGDVGFNPVFYKDYVISRTAAYRDPKTDENTSEIKIQTMDLKTISEKSLGLAWAKFLGSMGNFVFGYSDDPQKAFFVLKVPLWKITYSLPIDLFYRVIGNDGELLLLRLEDKITAINPNTGDTVWEYGLGAFILQNVMHPFTIGDSAYVFERMFYSHTKYQSRVSRIENGSLIQCLVWENPNSLGWYTEFAPFEDGLIKVPDGQTDVPVSIFDKDGKLVREIAIPELMDEKIVRYEYHEGFLYANSAGMAVYRIDIKTGKYESTKISDKPTSAQMEETNARFNIAVGQKYIVATNSTFDDLVLDRMDLSIVRNLGIFHFGILNGELLTKYNSSKIHVIGKDKTVSFTKTYQGPVWGDKLVLIHDERVLKGLTKISIIDQNGNIETKNVKYRDSMYNGLGFTFGDDFVSNRSATGIADNSFWQSMKSCPYITSFWPIKNGFIGSNDSSVWKLQPAPSYTIKRLSDLEFEVENTRTDGLGGDLTGSFAVCPWSSRFTSPGFAKLGQWISFGSIKPGEKKILTVGSDKNVTSSGRFAIIFESNGYLDRIRNFPDEENLPHYDGFSGIDPEKILSVTVWDELP